MCAKIRLFSVTAKFYATKKRLTFFTDSQPKESKNYLIYEIEHELILIEVVAAAALVA